MSTILPLTATQAVASQVAKLVRPLARRPAVEPNHSEGAHQRAFREFHVLVTSTVRFAVWALFWATAGTGAGLLVSAGHTTRAQVGITVAFALGFSGVGAFGLPLAWLWLSAPVVQRDEARAAIGSGRGRGEARHQEDLAELEQIIGDLDRLKADIGTDHEDHVGPESNQLTYAANRILRRIDMAKAQEFISSAPGETIAEHLDINIRLLQAFVDEQRGPSDH